ncbi:MAG: LysE family translocator [Bacteroidota bacterium]
MPGTENILLFAAASLLLALAPGPDNIFVLSQSMLLGRKAGFIVTLGLCTGLIFHTLAVALGLAVIFQTSSLAFNILKFLGALYLLYLSWNTFRKTDGPGRLPQENAVSHLYRRGIIMNVTNPKVSIFFLAFLPQFTEPAAGPVALQMVFLGIIFMLSTLLVFGGISQAAGAAGVYLLRSEKGGIWLNRISGMIFLGLAIKLLFTGR